MARTGVTCSITWCAPLISFLRLLFIKDHQADEDELEEVKPPIEVAAADGGLAIIAGSDTTSTVLTSVVYFLLHNPEAYKRLQAEIAEYFLPEEDPVDTARLASMPWLNACMYVLRSLYAPRQSRLIMDHSETKQCAYFLPSPADRSELFRVGRGQRL